MADPTNKFHYCPVELTLELVSAKWKPKILHHLHAGVHCFGDLSRRLPLIRQKKVTELLRELERDGLVERILYTEVPLRVEYTLTESGDRLVAILAQLDAFGREYAESREISIIDEVVEESDEIASGG